MTTAILPASVRVQSLCLTYLKLCAGRLDWSGDRVDAFLAQFKDTCAEANITVRDALVNAATALEAAGQTDLLPKPAGHC